MNKDLSSGIATSNEICATPIDLAYCTIPVGCLHRRRRRRAARAIGGGAVGGDGDIQRESCSKRDLLVWRKAHELVLAVYSFTAAFPKQETYGLTLQMRRAAVSIPANIAEGFRRRGKADKARYMNMAEGSLEECRYYLILSHDLGYGDIDALNVALEETSRLLNAYSAANA